MNAIDSFLNRITMYRLVLVSLLALAVISIVASALGTLSFTPYSLIFSLLVLLFASRIANAMFALFTRATPTPESALITGLILFFILAPMQSAPDAVYLALAATIAMLSKYLFAFGKKHIFNPAAFTAFAFSIVGSGIAVWWVATPILLVPVLVIGLTIVRKIRRTDVFFTFLAVALIVFLVRAGLAGTPLLSAASLFLVSFPVFFFGTIMLIEPQTMPWAKGDRRIYAVLVGLLFSLSFQFGTLSATPEFALLAGNLYTFAVGSRRRTQLAFHSSTKLSRNAHEFSFVPDSPLVFQPGQYIEWTVPHRRPDKRGIRRYFTVSSAPSDPFIRLGSRIPTESSTFKDALVALTKNSSVSATNVAGEFTLPHDPNQSVAAVAGGVGITPFMSMFRQLANDHTRRDIVLVYAAPSPLDFAYKDEIDSIKDSIGLRVIYLPTDFEELTNWSGPSGYLTEEFIQKEITDFTTRHWYLSGPTGMVENYKHLIRTLGVPRSSIKTDYFPGF